MEIEYEATFINIDKDEIRERLKKAGAKLISPEFLQTRIVYNLPKGHEIEGSWIRVRSERDKITMSLKICAKTEKIEDQKEIELEISSFEKADQFLETLGCKKKAFQENKREIWQLQDVEICIDEWPFLEPFVEIEAKSEQAVKQATQKLGFDYEKAKFCSIDFLHAEKYNISTDVINNDIPKLIFDMENPFIDSEINKRS